MKILLALMFIFTVKAHAISCPAKVYVKLLGDWKLYALNSNFKLSDFEKIDKENGARLLEVNVLDEISSRGYEVVETPEEADVFYEIGYEFNFLPPFARGQVSTELKNARDGNSSFSYKKTISTQGKFIFFKVSTPEDMKNAIDKLSGKIRKCKRV
jgi:hypothetical protein